MATCDLELFGCHVDTHNFARVTDERTEGENVSTRTTAQIQYARTVQRFWRNQATAVVAAQHFIMHFRKNCLEPVRHRVRCATRIGLQVSGRLQLLAVVFLDRFVLHADGLHEVSVS